MSKNDTAAIQNAEEVIQRFGGIRPMSSKIDVPVTTIQGWKKRNVIPANRREEILRAAREHDVDISDIVESGTANQNAPSSVPTASGGTAPGSSQKPDSFQETLDKQAGSDTQSRTVFATADIDQKLSETEKKAVTKSTLINLVLMGLAFGAFMALVWPQAQQTETVPEERLAALEEDIDAVKEEQGLLSGLIPDNLNERLDDLQSQAQQMREGMGTALTRAQIISSDVLGEDAGTLEERVARLEVHLSDIAGSPQVAALLERFNLMGSTPEGESTLDQSVTELSTLISGLQSDSTDQINIAVATAREDSNVLNQTLEGVPTQDLKAAALLLAMSQFRSSLNRDNEPFDEDMQLLLGLVGEDNPELVASLEKLAPKAEEGVLTPGGLNTEFRDLTGDIVVASLKGEDVSIRERAQARLSELLQIEKDNEPITGTSTQSTLSKTQAYLDEGNLEAAIAEMQNLDGEAAEAAAPWLADAQATLLAEQLKKMMTQTMNVSAYGRSALDAGGLLGGSELIQNKETGINILKIKKTPQGFKLPQQQSPLQ